MADELYWKNIIELLTDPKKANWAAHVLVSNKDSISEVSYIFGVKNFIKKCLLCYSVDFSAQPYLDEILLQFSLKDLVESYKELESKPIQTAGALMWLLEDRDPAFSWATYCK